MKPEVKAQQRDREFFRELIEASEPVYNGVNGTDKLDAAREMFKIQSFVPHLMRQMM